MKEELRWSYNPSCVLRFVERDGRKILQQLWTSQERGLDPVWQDIPLEVEGAFKEKSA